MIEYTTFRVVSTSLINTPGVICYLKEWYRTDPTGATNALLNMLDGLDLTTEGATLILEGELEEKIDETDHTWIVTIPNLYLNPQTPNNDPYDYLNNSGACPVCKSFNITADPIESESGAARGYCRCFDCDASWVDYYTLTGYEVNDEEEETT